MIRDRGVATRYAQALFGAALKEGSEGPTLEDLESLDRLYDLDRSLQRFLEAPDVLTEHKVELIHRVLGGRVSDLVERFLLLMLEKKRVQHLPLVFEHYRTLVEEHRGIVRAQVVTAVPFPGELEEGLKARLAALTGKKIILDRKVDPSIVGGVIVTLDGRILDASLRHRMQELRGMLLATRVH